MSRLKVKLTRLTLASYGLPFAANKLTREVEVSMLFRFP